MANETNFFLKKLLVWKEATKGVTPATIAKAFSLTTLSLSMAETQKTENNPVLGNGGQGARTDFGASEFAGNVEVKYTGGIMPIIAEQVIGLATKVNASVSSWVTATVTTVGNIVNGATYSLVCKVGGTTGGTAPVVVGKVDGDTIIDGTVTWIYRDAVLKKHTGSLSPCLSTIGIQIQTQTGCEVSPQTYDEIFSGVFLNSFEISKSAGNVLYKYSIPSVAMGKTDSTRVGYVAPTITLESPILDRSFGYDDAVVTVGGVEPVNTSSFRISVTRNTALEFGVKVGERIDNTPIVTVDGELKLKFTKEQYISLYDNPSKAVVVVLSKVNGDKATFTFPAVETMRAPLEFATDRPVYLTAKLNAYGSASTATVSYEVISTTDW